MSSLSPVLENNCQILNLANNNTTAFPKSVADLSRKIKKDFMMLLESDIQDQSAEGRLLFVK